MLSPAHPLVGRAAELGSLEEVLTRAERQGFAAVEVSGEPGIGKTRLLRELADVADRRDHIVLSGSASELEAELPFGLFADALDDYVRALPDDALDPLGPEARDELSGILPSVASRSPAAVTERHRAPRAVRALLDLIAEGSTLVLVLDDVHWADSGSLELLGALLRRPPAGSVMIALGVRPRQVPPALAAALERARRDTALARVELRPLGEQEARALLGEVDAAEATRLYGLSGGNPFYLEQLARSGVAENGATGAGRLEGLDVPPSVAASLAGEIAVLPPAARHVLAGAAVAGDPFEPELAAAAAGVAEPDVIVQLDELFERDLVRPTEVPRRFRFRHPLVRGAVYSTSPGGWRLVAHERCAAALEERGAPAAVRAHHVEHAGRHGDEAAVEVLAQAGREVVQRTPAGAARWFTAALRLLPSGAPDSRRVELLLALAGALAGTGRFEAARDAVLEGLELTPRDAVPVRLRLITVCSLLDTLMGRNARARERLETALSEHANAPAPEAVGLMLQACNNSVWLLDYAGAREWAAQAYRRAEAAEDIALRAAAAAAMALVCALSADVDAARRYVAESSAVFDAMSDAELAPLVGSLNQVATAEYYIERFETGARRSLRSLEIGRATQQVQLFPMLAPLQAIFLTFRGRLGEALELLDSACEAARLNGNRHALAWALFARAMTHHQRGDMDAAMLDGDESLQLSRDTDAHNVVACWAGLALGSTLIERGDAGQGVEVMMELAGGARLEVVAGSWRGYGLDRLVAGLLADGRRDEAVAVAAEATALAEATGLGITSMTADRAAARLALDAGDGATAAERALASAATAAGLGLPIEAARSKLLAGSSLAQAGRTAEAVAVLQEAASGFDECGALRWRDAAERELQRHGGRRLHRRSRPGRRDGDGTETLTARELEIARLIADRHTNAQIAAELFLSTKTIETHVRNLFHKLGVSSRVEVARVIERAGRDQVTPSS